MDRNWLVFRCDLCPEKFETHDQLRQHKSEKHASSTPNNDLETMGLLPTPALLPSTVNNAEVENSERVMTQDFSDIKVTDNPLSSVDESDNIIMTQPKAQNNIQMQAPPASSNVQTSTDCCCCYNGSNNDCCDCCCHICEHADCEDCDCGDCDCGDCDCGGCDCGNCDCNCDCGDCTIM